MIRRERWSLVCLVLLLAAGVVMAQDARPVVQPPTLPNAQAVDGVPPPLTHAQLQEIQIAWLIRENSILKAEQAIAKAEQDWQTAAAAWNREGFTLDLATGVYTAKKAGHVP